MRENITSRIKNVPNKITTLCRREYIAEQSRPWRQSPLQHFISLVLVIEVVFSILQATYLAHCFERFHYLIQPVFH